MNFNQEYLDKIVTNDSCEFLKDVSNWNNHRPLLYLALELSRTGDILELGCGDGSTTHLHCYSAITNRKIVSYDNNKEWVDRYVHLNNDLHSFVSSAEPKEVDEIVNKAIVNLTSVCLVDHAPGERRWEDIKTIANHIPFIVIHDSESEATGYMLNKIWGLFKYRLNLNSPGACATLVSNFIDVTQFDNMHLDKFILETRIK